MEKPNGPLDKSQESENQEKIENVYFGVFFDAKDMSLAAHYFDRGKYLREGEEMVSDVKENSIYKAIEEYSGYAASIVEQLPDNPVSKHVKTALDAKNSVQSKVDDLTGMAGGLNDEITNKLGEVPMSTDKDDESGSESLTGGRSIISKLEPCYTGDYFGTSYNFRIYTTGAITNKELKQKKEAEPDLDEETRKFYEKEAVEMAVSAVESKIKKCPQGKLSLHFDVFGYKKDPAVHSFIPEIDKFRQVPNVSELSIDFKGLYEKLHDKDEVSGSLGNIKTRFRELDKKL